MFCCCSVALDRDRTRSRSLPQTPLVPLFGLRGTLYRQFRGLPHATKLSCTGYCWLACLFWSVKTSKGACQAPSGFYRMVPDCFCIPTASARVATLCLYSLWETCSRQAYGGTDEEYHFCTPLTAMAGEAFMGLP